MVNFHRLLSHPPPSESVQVQYIFTVHWEVLLLMLTDYCWIFLENLQLGFAFKQINRFGHLKLFCGSFVHNGTFLRAFVRNYMNVIGLNGERPRLPKLLYQKIMRCIVFSENFQIRPRKTEAFQIKVIHIWYDVYQYKNASTSNHSKKKRKYSGIIIRTSGKVQSYMLYNFQNATFFSAHCLGNTWKFKRSKHIRTCMYKT